MKSLLAPEKRHKITRSILPLHDRWIASNWPFNFVRSPSLGPRRHKRCQTTRVLPDDGARRDDFTIAEHLHVQKEIEIRAYALWLEGGRRPDSAFANWTQAEREIIQEHCLARPFLGAASSI